MWPEHVEVWFRQTQALTDADAAAMDAVLSEAERARKSRFLQPEDRRDYGAAHELLRRTLSRTMPTSPAAWRFATHESGKPYLDQTLPAPHFSLTHTRGLVACAISGAAPVGVDVERVDPAFDVGEVAGRVLSSAELNELARRSEAERIVLFAELWTLKEALLKVTGAGLRRSPSDLSFRVESGRITLAGDGNEHAWAFALFAPSTDTRLAVAVAADGSVPEITVRDVSAPSIGLVPIQSAMAAAVPLS